MKWISEDGRGINKNKNEKRRCQRKRVSPEMRAGYGCGVTGNGAMSVTQLDGQAVGSPNRRIQSQAQISMLKGRAKFRWMFIYLSPSNPCPASHLHPSACATFTANPAPEARAVV